MSQKTLSLASGLIFLWSFLAMTITSWMKWFITRDCWKVSEWSHLTDIGAGSDAEHAIVLDLIWDSNETKIPTIDVEVLKTKTFPPDPQLAEKVVSSYSPRLTCRFNVLILSLTPSSTRNYARSRRVTAPYHRKAQEINFAPLAPFYGGSHGMIVRGSPLVVWKRVSMLMTKPIAILSKLFYWVGGIFAGEGTMALTNTFLLKTSRAKSKNNSRPLSWIWAEKWFEKAFIVRTRSRRPVSILSLPELIGRISSIGWWVQNWSDDWLHIPN